MEEPHSSDRERDEGRDGAGTEGAQGQGRSPEPEASQDHTDPFGHGSLGWRLPWAETGEGDLLDGEAALELFLDWCEDRGLELWDHQQDALLDLAAGDNVILGTPTGSGKSMVALGLAFMAMAQGTRCYYTAPIKALVSEKFFDMVEVLGKDNVGMITGDVVINGDAPVVCCTAEILANQALREGAGSDVGCVAMDEFHFFGDPDRGWAWQVPLLCLPHTQFLLMSATLGDVSAIAASLETHTGRSVDLVLDAPRPVPLAYDYVLTPLEATVELALRAGEGPLYIVHFSQAEALKSAQALSSYGVATKEQRAAIKEAIKGTRFTTPFGKILQRLLLSGVGVHHAGMLPRYRLLVEKLAQQGLLPVICGTDTLGVGINVPIHTVLLTALAKYDGHRMRRLRSREFHQIAGRAGRAGFDLEGRVIVEAPEHDIENERARQKAGDDPRKLRRIKRKQPPKGFVGWNRDTFEHLVASQPETLRPHLKVTHSMVLCLVERGGDAWADLMALIADSAQTDEEKAALTTRAAEIFATLLDGGVIVRHGLDGGEPPKSLTEPSSYELTVDLPEDFALDQPLSPFMLAALELLDPEEPTYALDVISVVEATLEDPRQVLWAQERRARDAAWAAMRAEGVDHEERLERIEEVTYEKPLEELLDAAFEAYCREVPWARDHELHPKSVLRAMVEGANDFKTYVGAMGIARNEGTLLRYLSDCYRVLDRTVPLEKRDERLDDIIAWLGYLVRNTDSSLVDEWEGAGEAVAVAPPTEADLIVPDRHGLTVQVRNALFRHVIALARRDAAALGEMDREAGIGERRWRELVEEYHEAHDEVLLDGDARSSAYLVIDEGPEADEHRWHVRQIVHDGDGDDDFAIVADVDLDASREAGDVVLTSMDAGFPEGLAE